MIMIMMRMWSPPSTAATTTMHRRFLTCICWVLLFAYVQRQNAVQASGFGRCPKYPSMPKFNMTKFLGTWYELERSFYLPEIASACTSMTFSENKDELGYNGNNIEITLKSVNQWTGGSSQNVGNAKTVTERSSIMDILFQSRFPSVIARLLPGSGKYQVLFTDYERFTILWSCSGIGPVGHTDQIWLLGRKRADFEVDMRTKIHDTMNKLGLDPDRLMVSKNKDCTTV